MAESRSYETRKLSDAIGSLRSAEGQCVVLMGAGCSLSAGIPLAGTLIRDIERHFPEAFARATRAAGSGAPGYNACMEQLSPNQRQKLLNAYIEKARINWAHLALAQMFERQVIDRVLTVNFDPLLPKACALVNFFPAIYDLADTANFRSHRIAPRSLFFLNGQHTGFVMLNAADELEAHRRKLKTIVDDTGIRRLWLVIGYSGEADPLLDVLASIPCFDGDLYWLGHGAEPSERLVASSLFSKGRHAFYVGGQDADACLTELAQELAAFPPRLLINPFEHVREVVQAVDFETGGPVAKQLLADLTDRLNAAVRHELKSIGRDNKEARTWMLAGEYQRVLDWYAALPHPTSDAGDLAAWAWVMLGLAEATKAQTLATTDLSDAQALWKQAGEKYAQALAIKADKHEAAYNWGSALSDEAQAVALNDLSEGRRLWTLAGEKYAQALAIRADKHEAANNWGNALSNEAQAVAPSDLAEGRRLWTLAGEKYAQALAIKADKHDAANNWGNALSNEAQAVAPSDLAEGRRLWTLAGEKYAQALAIRADKHEAAYNWGNALSKEAQAVALNDLAEGRRLWTLAGEKYAQALAIKADKHDAANNWGNALSDEAQAVAPSDLAESRRLWTLAGEKYAQALAIKADMHDAANNWGIALSDEAQAVAHNDLAEGRRLWTLAGEKYAQALAIKADKHEAAYNWGNALSAEAEAVAPSDLAEGRRLWEQAGEKYAQVLAIKADLHDAADAWATLLLKRFRAEGDERTRSNLLKQARELLESHAAMTVSAAAIVAYNLACAYALEGDVPKAVAQLKLCHGAGTLPLHWRDDADLDPIRNSPEFQGWVAMQFPP